MDPERARTLLTEELAQLDAEAPADEHPWECDCPRCSAIHEAAAEVLAYPDERADGPPKAA